MIVTARAVPRALDCSSAEDSGLYSGGVPLGGGDPVGDGIADGAMSFVFASARSFFSSG